MHIKRTMRMVGESYLHKRTDTVWELAVIGIDNWNGKYKMLHGNTVRWVTSEELDREFELFLYAP